LCATAIIITFVHAADVAVLLAMLYLREGKILEAKKLAQQAVNSDWSNNFARLVLAQALFVDKRYDQVIKLLDRPVFDHNSPLDTLAVSLCGRANIALGDIRTGLLQMDAATTLPYNKDVRLLDELRILAAQEYELREYLLDALDNLKEVTEQFRIYHGDETVDAARERVTRRINTLQAEGVSKQLRLLDKKVCRSERANYWEVKASEPRWN